MPQFPKGKTVAVVLKVIEVGLALEPVFSVVTRDRVWVG